MLVVGGVVIVMFECEVVEEREVWRTMLRIYHLEVVSAEREKILQMHLLMITSSPG